MREAGDNEIFSIKNRLLRLKRDSNRWSLIALFVVLLIALPILTIIFELFEGPGESWIHIVKNLLGQYISNSVYLLIVCSLLVLLFGVTTSWLVARYEFPFRKQLEWLLILPLAIPSYIVAYAYAGAFDYGGSLELIQRFFGIEFTRIDIMNRFGLAFVLSISLFPYVYVSTRAFFLNQANNLLEASRLLGVGEFRTFFKLILPLARPAIIAGMILVLMEVLNDYGAAQYFGVNTFTTGIFRSWFSLEEPETAIYLSALLLVLVFALILFEKWQRRKVQYSNESTNSERIYRKQTSKRKQFVIFCIVITPVLFGFLIPLAQLIYWAVLTYSSVFDATFVILSLQTFGIAFLTATVTVIFATLLIFSAKWNRIGFIKNLSRLGVLGYAIPGAVIAIGIMIPTLALDRWLMGLITSLSGNTTGFIIHGTLFALVYAYAVRFLAVAYNPIESTTLKVSNAIPDASKTLGVGNFKTFFKIEYPLIKTGMLSAFILVFVDVLKELPLTLILKPFQVNTLAVRAFEYASDERVMEAAIPSLFIIFTAAVPVIFLNKLLVSK
ncbi:MAG: iron ABC transporter permease [Flavobacteriaceae bacterium]|nr:iron ABC transporter permease [Flavobacteriaceae bacterium]